MRQSKCEAVQRALTTAHARVACARTPQRFFHGGRTLSGMLRACVAFVAVCSASIVPLDYDRLHAPTSLAGPWCSLPHTCSIIVWQVCSASIVPHLALRLCEALDYLWQVG